MTLRILEEEFPQYITNSLNQCFLFIYFCCVYGAQPALLASQNRPTPQKLKTSFTFPFFFEAPGCYKGCSLNKTFFTIPHLTPNVLLGSSSRMSAKKVDPPYRDFFIFHFAFCIPIFHIYILRFLIYFIALI